LTGVRSFCGCEFKVFKMLVFCKFKVDLMPLEMITKRANVESSLFLNSSYVPPLPPFIFSFRKK